jgi:hypothetical protein
MTNQVGDLPLKNALKGLGDGAPAYDTQKEIYVQVLKWLDESNTELASTSTSIMILRHGEELLMHTSCASLSVLAKKKLMLI